MSDAVPKRSPASKDSLSDLSAGPILRDFALLKQQLDDFQKHEHDNSGNVIDFAGDVLYNAAYTGLQRPVRSIGQLVDDGTGGKSGVADVLTIMPKPEEASHGSKRYYAQQLGNGVGFFVPLAATSLALKGSGLSLAAKAEGLASTGKLFSVANGVRLADGALTGFTSDFLFSPVEENEGNHLKARLYHGATGAAMMTTMTAGGLGARSMTQSIAKSLVGEGVAKQVGRFAYEGTVGVTSGIPAGVVSADVNSRLWHGRAATAEERINSAYTMAWTGGLLSAAHIMPTDRSVDPLAVARLQKAEAKRTSNQGESSSKSAPAIVTETGRSVTAEGHGNSLLVGAKNKLRSVDMIRPEKIKDGETSSDAPKPTSTKIEDFPNGRRVERHVYADGKVVEHHTPSSVPGMGDSIFTTFADGTTKLENRDGTYTSKPDGSWVHEDSYRTLSSERGEVHTKWAIAVRDWYELSTAQKLEALSDIEAVPRGGNAGGNLVERGLFDADPAVRERAVSQIPSLKDSSVQAELWKSAWGNYPELQNKLTEMVPKLQEKAREIVDQTEARKNSPDRIAIKQLHQKYNELIKDAPVKFSDDYQTRNAPFELIKRARRDGLSDADVRETMQTVVDLLEIGKQNKGMKTAQEFQMAAIQVMRQAADPLIITQGDHPTCAIASLETTMYIKNPAAAARLVSEVLRTGEFVTTDGTKIPIDVQSLMPESRALEGNKTKFSNPDDVFGYRSYASQIFQTTAVNVYWQRQGQTPWVDNLTPHVQTVPVGSMKYEVRTKPDGKGGVEQVDELVDYTTGKRRVLDDGPSVTTLKELQDMSRMIGGERGVPTILQPRSPQVASRQAFDNFINSLKPEQFPVIIGIDANVLRDPSKPFKSLNHAVTLLKPPGGQAYIHNTWRPFSDVHQPGYWIKNTLDIEHLLSILNVQK